MCLQVDVSGVGRPCTNVCDIDFCWFVCYWTTRIHTITQKPAMPQQFHIIGNIHMNVQYHMIVEGAMSLHHMDAAHITMTMRIEHTHFRPLSGVMEWRTSSVGRQENTTTTDMATPTTTTKTREPAVRQWCGDRGSAALMTTTTTTSMMTGWMSAARPPPDKRLW